MSSAETRAMDEQGAMAGGPPMGPVPTPPDFPVVWEQSGDEQIFWHMDRMHFPTQVAPLADSFIRTTFGVGFNRAAEVYSAPVMAAARRFNTYHYEFMGPPMLPPQELEAMGAQAQE